MTIVHKTKKTKKYIMPGMTLQNTCNISWDSCDVFCPSNVGFCELASQSLKFNIEREGTHLFVGIWVLHRVSLPYRSGGIFI